LFYSEARNRDKSPLLRLPGELRNKVYEYALSGITLFIFPSSNVEKPYRIHVHLAEEAASFSPAFDVTGLNRVCRQISAETRLLPFQFLTFHIHSDGSFLNFVETLNDVDRDAIATVQISTPDANAGGTLCHAVANSLTNDEVSQRNHLDLLEWSWHLSLDRLGGLKQVVVEEDMQWVYSKAEEHFLRDGISNCVKGRNVDIVIPTLDKPGHLPA
jgi:hypothetical protein